MGLIQDQGVIPPFRDADPVLRSRNGSKVADKQQVLFAGLTAADETEDAAVSVIGIDPLKTVPVIIQAVHGRIFFVDVEQIPEIVLQVPVKRFFRQIPVQRNLLIPLVKLAEILTHEQKLFARMSHHESVSYFQIGEFIVVKPGHLVDHGAF